jgi:pentatricopeptide repeat protein
MKDFVINGVLIYGFFRAGNIAAGESCYNESEPDLEEDYHV